MALQHTVESVCGLEHVVCIFCSMRLWTFEQVNYILAIKYCLMISLTVILEMPVSVWVEYLHADFFWLRYFFPLLFILKVCLLLYMSTFLISYLHRFTIASPLWSQHILLVWVSFITSAFYHQRFKLNSAWHSRGFAFSKHWMKGCSKCYEITLWFVFV